MNETRIPSRARRVRLGSIPSISVVVASAGPLERLEALLAELRGPCADLEAELVVARTGEGAELASLRAAHAGVRFVGLPAGEPIAELRAAGMEAANGDVVRIFEDRHPLPAAWAAPLVAARTPGRRVAGERVREASVEAGTPAIDWRAYFSEQPQPERID